MRALLVLLSLIVPACASSADREPIGPRAVLMAQVDAWNRGDLEDFVNGYRRSDQTVFASPSRVHVGFDAMVERYRRRYPDRGAMGTLRFEDLEIEAFARDHALVNGTWVLERSSDEPWGRFLLVMRRVGDRWRIVLDYTTFEGDRDAP